MMVNGPRNSVVETEFTRKPQGEDNVWGNVFNVSSRTLTTESAAAREADGARGRYWKIINPNVTNAVGGHPGYKLVAEHNPVILALPDSPMGRRAGFAQKHLWVTPYDPQERYGSGEFPNQNPGDGLPVWTRKDRAVENEDIVVWHTFGHTHVCKPEDFPVMPVMYVGFKLMPNGFFDGNPAMDLPGQRDARSVNAGIARPAGGCCMAEGD